MLTWLAQRGSLPAHRSGGGAGEDEGAGGSVSQFDRGDAAVELRDRPS